MCGIVAYIGSDQAYPILMKGLNRLEYRGYDSVGIALLLDGQISVFKKAGKVKDLEAHVDGENMESNMGIGHTRWATHGLPNDVNAHPHSSRTGRLTVVHNGIIENFVALREELLGKGYTFKSDTDTEVLVNFIEDVWNHHEGTFEEAVGIALQRVVGAYGIVLLSADHPHKLIAVRKSSPLVVGIGENECFVASDASPFLEYTKEVMYLKDNQIAVITAGDFSLMDYKSIAQTPYIETVDLELEEIEKSGYDHYMLKEINEQPKSVADCMRGRIHTEFNQLILGGIEDHAKHLYKAERILITACGTSYYAGLVAEYLIEELCRIPVEVEYASEFRYRNPIIRDGDVVVAISQSGETADTLAAIELSKQQGAIVFGVCNVVGSSIARETHAGVYTHAGPEIGVASTKAFTAQ
ncbi:MAG: glutamine--fructose-6-phosphate transaminase (isomerizing), partial [Saprospiraceae bacterium]|nr:glutamine--fructose-6-phosphate transaminase (isomerizing) [Saprospiraceae bacterium]